MFITSVSELKSRLADVEDRLAIARARRMASPVVAASLEAEASALRERLWSLRRQRALAQQAVGA